jgi:hypothetical protein
VCGVSAGHRRSALFSALAHSTSTITGPFRFLLLFYRSVPSGCVQRTGAWSTASQPQKGACEQKSTFYRPRGASLAPPGGWPHPTS